MNGIRFGIFGLMALWGLVMLYDVQYGVMVANTAYDLVLFYGPVFSIIGAVGLMIESGLIDKFVEKMKD